MTSGTASHRQRVLDQMRQADASRARRRRLWRVLLIVGPALAVVAVVAAMMLSVKPTSSTAARPAPDFTLTNTSGQQVSLSSYRGQDVVLYFSEGASCGSCMQQLSAIEQDANAFTAAGITVLPIVMDPLPQITQAMQVYNLHTPFLLDDGRVSREYNALGTGMHADLPGHGFVLIDADGVQRWHGEYPSMWLDPTQLLDQVRTHLA